jgi:hypothetical protein
MAGKDQQQNAKAHITKSPLPDFFTNTPAIWFQHPEARFAVARPAPTSGQKYFQLLGKLPQDLIVNFTDIIAQCTTATARINSGKTPSCNSQPNLNGHATLTCTHCPGKGDIMPSELTAKLISLMPENAPINTDLFFSFFLFTMPQSIREALAATNYMDARSMATADDRIWVL